MQHPDRVQYDASELAKAAAEWSNGDMSVLQKASVDPYGIYIHHVPTDPVRDQFYSALAEAGDLPCVVLAKNDHHGYTALSGVRKIRAAAMLGTKVPAIIVDKKIETDPSEDPSGGQRLDKDSLPEVGIGKGHRMPSLPVGTEVNGEVKVQHQTGKAGWRSVRAGKILGTDPTPLYGQTSHPVSSREPGSS
jgi:hypothetical protein